MPNSHLLELGRQGKGANEGGEGGREVGGMDDGLGPWDGDS